MAIPTVYGVGYVGTGPHPVAVDRKVTKGYKVWSGMLRRAYSEGLHSVRPTYKEVEVDPDWWDFQVFADWYYKQNNCNSPGFDLDKDLRLPGNKLYCPAACSLVPSAVNKLVNPNKKIRGYLPLGVSKNKSKYRATLTMWGQQRVLGTYPTPGEAHRAYVLHKLRHVKELAELHREQLHPEVYTNLSTGGWYVAEG